MMDSVLRPLNPETDFPRLAEWYSLLEPQPSTPESLRAFYESARLRSVQCIAQDTAGALAGFAWATRQQNDFSRCNLDIYVDPARRRQGLGSQLYARLEELLAAQEWEGPAARIPLSTRQVMVWDNCPECLAFALRRGYVEVSHGLEMVLDLDAFDEQPFLPLIPRLQAEGFLFTNMQELGDTPEARRQLYQLNETADSQTPGTDGSPAWGSFELFEQSVCQAEWYHPEAQFVVIDQANGRWAAMSAITRFAGADFAYNLFTGVESSYRGRKLAQAVKTRALLHARQALRVHSVRTSHNVMNLPMIAIDRKMGYRQLPGLIRLEKKSPAFE